MPLQIQKLIRIARNVDGFIAIVSLLIAAYFLFMGDWLEFGFCLAGGVMSAASFAWQPLALVTSLLFKKAS